ncbi:MAG: sulfite exporter TauE/SafE family protein [Methanobacteriota archaeon]|nr:MAG: sulfite exporter TauE/SafE family protein [Euryarchaeota archaeon]
MPVSISAIGKHFSNQCKHEAYEAQDYLSLMELFFIVLLAIFVATFSVMAGLGGGVLMVPLLALGTDYPFSLVAGSVLISLTVPALIGSFGAFRRGEIDFRLAALFEIPTAIGAVLGAHLSVGLDEGLLKLLFASIAALLAREMLRKSNLDDDALPVQSLFWKRIGEFPPFLHLEKRGARYRISLPSLIGGGLIIGLLSGMFGVGGGWLKTPLLVIAFGVPPVIASGTAIFMILFTALIGGSAHYLAGNFDPNLTFSLVVGLGLGSIIGNWLKPRLRTQTLTKVIVFVLFMVSLALLINGISLIIRSLQ